MMVVQEANACVPRLWDEGLGAQSRQRNTEHTQVLIRADESTLGLTAASAALQQGCACYPAISLRLLRSRLFIYPVSFISPVLVLCQTKCGPSAA